MTAPTIASQRALIRPLLDTRSPADALAVYYALYHDPDRTAIFVHDDPHNAGQTNGFLVRARTGYDLFRPLVTFRAPDEAAAIVLFRRGLPAGRPVYLTVPESLAPWALNHLQVTDMQLMAIYALDPARYEPIINVLVTRERTPEGLPRYEIRSGDRVHAAAGLNWRSPTFAEVYVHTEAAARQRGWGKSVVAGLTGSLLGQRIKPLYVVEESNSASIRLAESVGFRDTGLRQFVGQAILADT